MKLKSVCLQYNYYDFKFYMMKGSIATIIRQDFFATLNLKSERYTCL